MIERAVQKIGIMVYCAKILRPEQAFQRLERRKIHAAPVQTFVSDAEKANIPDFSHVHFKGKGVVGEDVHGARFDSL